MRPLRGGIVTSQTRASRLQACVICGCAKCRARHTGCVCLVDSPLASRSCVSDRGVDGRPCLAEMLGPPRAVPQRQPAAAPSGTRHRAGEARGECQSVVAGVGAYALASCVLASACVCVGVCNGGSNVVNYFLSGTTLLLCSFSALATQVLRLGIPLQSLHLAGTLVGGGGGQGEGRESEGQVVVARVARGIVLARNN